MPARPARPRPMVATEMEVWEHQAPGETYLLRFDEFGNPTTERLMGKKTINLTPAERRLNQSGVQDPSLDPFTNGRLAPAKLLDSEPDTEDLRANPNAMSETGMRSLFDTPAAAFTARVAEITNPLALKRLREIASEVDARARQVEAIESRLEEIQPAAAVRKVKTAHDVARDAKTNPTDGFQ